MKMQTMLSVSAITMAVLGSMPRQAAADWWSDWFLFEAYQDEGSYVVVPAKAGAIGGAIVGGVAAVPPAVVIGSAVGLVTAPFSDGVEFAAYGGLVSWAVICICTARGTSAVVGAPFYVTKKVFWDGPRALVGGAKKR